MRGTKDFEPAHLLYSQALVGLANPYSVVFAESRNSSVVGIQGMQKAISENPIQRLEQARKTVAETRENFKRLNASATSISACRAAIEGLMHKAPSAVLEQHVDIFRDEHSDSGKEDGDWEQIGSDEEIIN
jgi:hypothetical protein